MSRGQEVLPAATINDRVVDVTVDNLDDVTYRITAIATSPSGESTTLETSFDIYRDYSGLFGWVLGSVGDMNIEPGAVIIGDVQHGGLLTNKGTINGTVTASAPDPWPVADEVSEFFFQDVKGEPPYQEGVSDVTILIEEEPWATDGIGPLYRPGNLNIKSNGGAGLHVSLSGTVYAAGDLSVGTDGHSFVLHTNGHTIFAEGGINVGGKVTIEGTGSFVALGDVYVSPKVSSSSGTYLFGMSVQGLAWLNPSGTLYGGVAAYTSVNIQPDVMLEWGVGSDGLDFPGNGDSRLAEVISWDIK